jgi:hypothetical protein
MIDGGIVFVVIGRTEYLEKVNLKLRTHTSRLAGLQDCQNIRKQTFDLLQTGKLVTSR